jgi:hypothetical protein
MALIDCPSCGKKNSSKAAVCSHCQFNLQHASDEDVLRKEKLNRFKQKNRIQTQSMLAMMLFVGGFAVMYWGDTQYTDLRYKLAVVASIIGFCWYVFGRIWLILIRMKEK